MTASWLPPPVPGLQLALSNHVLEVTFDRPEAGNPITRDIILALTSAFTAARADAAVRCVLVRGKGRFLSAGGDVSGFADSLEKSPAERSAEYRERLETGGRLVMAVVSFDRPIVTVHRGTAAGAGLLFTLAADVVLADDTANLVLAHQRIGLPPDGGLSALLPQVVGWRVAKRLILTAAKVEAAEALRLGLVDQILPAEQLDAEASKWTERFAHAPQQAVRSAKRLLDERFLAELPARLAAETEAIAAAVADADFVEGVSAFLGKRPTRFPSSSS